MKWKDREKSRSNGGKSITRTEKDTDARDMRSVR